MDEITFKHVSMTYKISIIIPVYNEEDNVLSLLKYLEKNSSKFISKKSMEYTILSKRIKSKNKVNESDRFL